MSNPRLPPELLDHTIDFLQDTEHALRNCCLVSKSWIPRTRKHLFAHIRFLAEGHLKSWEEIFSDPSTSPSHYTRILYVYCAHVVAAADAGAGGWITGFSRVVRLEVGDCPSASREPTVSLVPFHGLSPTVKSLRMVLPALSSTAKLDFVLSFPLLEDLTAITIDHDAQDEVSHGLSTAVRPPSSPGFTGSLRLFLRGGMGPIVRRLLSLPGGIHFRRLDLTWPYERDTSSVVGLVKECSHTLESLRISCNLLPVYRPALIDLSKATRLKDVAFGVNFLHRVNWITMELQTLAPKHQDLRQISIYVPYNPHFASFGADVRQIIGKATYGQWPDFDRILVQIWESRSIRPMVTCTRPVGTQSMRYCIEWLLPEVTRRGIMDLVE